MPTVALAILIVLGTSHCCLVGLCGFRFSLHRKIFIHFLMVSLMTICLCKNESHQQKTLRK